MPSEQKTKRCASAARSLHGLFVMKNVTVTTADVAETQL
jgi:hypothetical protein